jgi:hypothetical protein
MKLGRLRAGELIALAGSVCIFVSLALPWYESPSGELSAWSTFGVAVAVLIVAAVMGVGLALATVLERSSAIPVAMVVWTVIAGLAAVVAALVRVLERPEHATGADVGAWLALAGAVALLAGSWQSMRDERTSAFDPPEIEPRVAPPASAPSDGAGAANV